MGWIFRSRHDRDHLAEFDDHLRSLTDLYISDGLSPAEAARRAHVRFGNAGVHLQGVRDEEPWNGVRLFLRDLLYAVRVLRRSPAFTLAASATLALGLGANAAVFSVVNSVLLRPLPYPHPQTLVGISFRSNDPKRFASTVPSPVFLAWRAPSRSLQGVAGYQLGQIGYRTADGVPVQLLRASVTGNFLSLLDPNAVVAGRLFTAEEVRGVGPPVALLTSRFVRRYLGTDHVLGRAVRFGGSLMTVIGLVGDDFRFPAYDTPDVYTPIDLRVGSQVVVGTKVIGRLVPGASAGQAAADLEAASEAARPTFPSAMTAFLAADPKPIAVPLAQTIVGDLRSLLVLALGASTCILLLACANVAGLFVARSAGRTREFAMRAALGATAGRLVTWLLTESLALSALGATVGGVLLVLGLGSLRYLLAGVVPHAEAIALDRTVAAYSGSCLAVAALACTAIPVFRMRRHPPEIVRALSSAGGTGPLGSDRARRLLVAGEVAVALALVVGALLLASTLRRLSGVNLGFDEAHLATAKVMASFGNYQNRSVGVDALLARVRELPGVSAAGASTSFPLGGHAFGFTVPVDGEPAPIPIAHDATGVDVVSPGYFEALNVALLDGRMFDDRDTATASPVAIVNAAFVRANLHGREPIESRLGLGGDPNISVVGVIGDLKDGNPAQPAQPTVYRPFAQSYPQLGWGSLGLAVRTSADSDALLPTVRRLVAEAEPDAVIYDVQTMEDRVAAVVAPQRLRAVISALFASTAVLLCVVGLYGLLAAAVEQSRRELGVRLALGAARRDLVVLTLRRALVPTGVGLCAGLGAAVVVAHLLAGRLFGIGEFELTTYVQAAALIMVVALVAAGVPAYRASTIDPVRVLRAD